MLLICGAPCCVVVGVGLLWCVWLLMYIGVVCGVCVMVVVCVGCSCLVG